MEPSPDKKYGPQLADLFTKYCLEVSKETEAIGVRVEAMFVFRSGRGDLKLKTFTTPDAKVERMLDPDVPMARGAKLQHDAAAKLKSIYAGLKKLIGGK
jgi:hypothetical protein